MQEGNQRRTAYFPCLHRPPSRRWDSDVGHADAAYGSYPSVPPPCRPRRHWPRHLLPVLPDDTKPRPPGVRSVGLFEPSGRSMVRRGWEGTRGNRCEASRIRSSAAVRWFGDRGRVGREAGFKIGLVVWRGQEILVSENRV